MTAEQTAKKILEAMQEQFTELTEQPVTHTLQIQFNTGYGSAMHDLQHVIGDMFPKLKA
jgi:hypothetical protein